MPPTDIVYPVIESQLPETSDLPGSELADKGRSVKGIYVPVGLLTTMPTEQAVHWVVDKIGASAVIIDIKDDVGRVTFTTELPGVKGTVFGVVPHMADLIARLKEKGVYTIGRLVCFKDNKYAMEHPELAIRDVRTKKTWRARLGGAWLDPYAEKVRDYITAVAVAARNIGFEEIQVDYVRFPVEAESRYASYTHHPPKMERYEAISGLLAQMDRALDIPLSADVFGLTAYNIGDPSGLGQSLEHLAPYLDAISPMLYLANWPVEVWQNPTRTRTQAMVRNAVLNIRQRLGDKIAVRPLLQAFPYRAKDFGTEFITDQISAAETAGSSGYLFWNQAGRYGTLVKAWRQ